MLRFVVAIAVDQRSDCWLQLQGPTSSTLQEALDKLDDQTEQVSVACLCRPIVSVSCLVEAMLMLLL